MEGSIWGPLFLQITLLFINAIFASAEIAVISMNDNRLARMAADGDKRAIRLTKLTDKPSQFLSVIQISITLASLLGGAFAADNFDGLSVSLFSHFHCCTCLCFKLRFGSFNNIAFVLCDLSYWRTCS